MDCLKTFVSPQLELLHRGKVRDSLRIDEQTRMIVVTDRISAFNQKIKTPIPTKGAVLNGIANYWFEQTKHIIGNHVIRQVDDYITLVKEAQPIRIEMIARGYLTGSMWRGYEKGQRTFSGVSVADGMHKNQKFAQPILTPTTKDEDDTEIDEKGIIEAGIVSEALYQQMKEKALALFNFGTKLLADRGIILVDTKYEFGLLDGQLILIDEMHTPDSSRFWDAEDYAQQPATAQQIDKEFVRQWLLANKEGDEVPTVLSDEVVAETTKRYQKIYSRVTQKDFEIADLPTQVRIYNNLLQAEVIQQGVLFVIGDKVDKASLEGQLANYDIALKVLAPTAVETTSLAATVNQTIEPIVVVQMDQDADLASALDEALAVPFLQAAQEQDWLKSALRCFNLSTIREKI